MGPAREYMGLGTVNQVGATNPVVHLIFVFATMAVRRIWLRSTPCLQRDFAAAQSEVACAIQCDHFGVTSRRPIVDHVATGNALKVLGSPG